MMGLLVAFNSARLNLLLLEISSVIIYLCSLQCSMGDRIALLLDPSIQYIPLGEVGCIDVKVTSEKIGILKDNGLVLQTLSSTEVDMEDMCYYALQEEFVADQLFQSPENSSDELLLITHSIFSSAKDHIVAVVSAIFLCRFLQPGIHHSIALHSTFLDYNKYWTDSDFQTSTSNGLKEEILSLIEHEGVAENLMSIHCSWKNFCTHYFHNGCKIMRLVVYLLSPQMVLLV